MYKDQISRRQFLKVSTCSLGAISLNSGLQAAEISRSSPGKPNIMFIFTDDQRWDTLGCAGNPIIQTPFIDNLAHNGVRFEYAFITSPACAPSRACIFTGLYERTHCFTFGTPPLARVYSDMSYPQLLRQAGYRTGYVGKHHVSLEKGAQAQMFDSFEPLGRTPYIRKVNGKDRHLCEIMGDTAVDFLESCTHDQPFCLSLSFHSPHAEDDDPRQFIWPASCDDLYKDDTIPYPTTTHLFNKMTGDLQTCFNRMRWWQRFCTPEKYQEMVKGYYRMISGIDMVIGRLMDELKKRGMDQNTIIFLMGDNGYFLGERGFGGKFMMYEQSLRVPLIIYDPRRPSSSRGIVLKEMAMGIDIAPTILEMAGVDIPEDMHGRSLVPLLNGERIEWRTEFFCEYTSTEFPSIIQSEGYRTEKWKYLRYINRANSEELYDLANDPLEEHNLALEQQYREQLLELRKRCNLTICKLVNDRKDQY